MATTGSVNRADRACNIALYTSDAALGAGTVTSGTIPLPANFDSAEFTVVATIGGTTTLNVYIQKLLPSGDWDDIVSFTQISATIKKSFWFQAQIPTADHTVAIATLTAGTLQKTGLGEAIRVQAVVAGASPDAALVAYGSFFTNE